MSDHGIGMDTERIQQYLLHAGRSFYDSTAFRKQYGFVAASRFGVGFLSVFGVSDRVEVWTKAMGSGPDDGIRLELHGPRNYVLVESSDQGECGTKVSVELREQIDPGQLERAVRSWCTRSEFPVHLTIHGESTIILHEAPSAFETTVSVDAAGVSSFDVLSFPVASPIARGELYVLQQTGSDGRVRWDIESFDLGRWVEQNAPMLPVVPEAPRSMLALHGIETVSHWGHEMSLRVDARASQAQRRLNLSRERSREPLPMADLGLDEEIERVVNDHFTATNANRSYRARVVKALNVPWRIASRLPEMVKVWRPVGGAEAPCSALWSWSELEAQSEFWVVYGKGLPEAEMTHADVENLATLECLVERAETRLPSLRYGDDVTGIRAIDVRCSPDRNWYAVRCEPTNAREYQLAVIPASGGCFESGEILIALGIGSTSLDTIFLNCDHTLVKELAGASSRELKAGKRFRVNWTRSGSDPMDVLDLFLASVRGALSYGVRRRPETDLTSAMAPFVEAAGQKQGTGKVFAPPHSQYLVVVYGTAAY